MPSGFEDRCALRISGFSDSEHLRFSEFLICPDFMVFEIHRFFEFVTSRHSRFSDFFGFG